VLPRDEPRAVGIGTDDAQSRPARAEMGAGSTAAPGTDEGAPERVIHRLDEEQLDGTAVDVLCRHARGDDPRVVHHQAIARAQQPREVTEDAIREGAGGAVHCEEARAITTLGRRLGDALGRQLVVELRHVHDG